MFEILTVCTGNICRSPLAEMLLRQRLSDPDLEVRVRSAGTHDLNAASMTPEAQRLAAELGADIDGAAAHRSRHLTEAVLSSPDLVLAMTREHRTRVVALAPSRMRRAFTAREFARLAESVSDEEIRTVARTAGDDPAARMRAAIALVADRRGMVPAPADVLLDDVVDPYRRSWATYQRSGTELISGVEQVARILTVAARD